MDWITKACSPNRIRVTHSALTGFTLGDVHWCSFSVENEPFRAIVETPKGEEALINVVVKFGAGKFVVVGSLINFCPSSSLTLEQERLLNQRNVPIIRDTTKATKKEWDECQANEDTLNKPIDEWEKARDIAMMRWDQKNPPPPRKFVKGSRYLADTWRTMTDREAKIYEAKYGEKPLNVPIIRDTTKATKKEWDECQANEDTLNKPIDKWEMTRDIAMLRWERNNPPPPRNFIKGSLYSTNTWRTMTDREAKIYEAKYGEKPFGLF